MHSLRVIVERRARSVVWEFDLALGRLAARRPPRLPFADATRLNWREALTRFADRANWPTRLETESHTSDIRLILAPMGIRPSDPARVGKCASFGGQPWRRLKHPR